MTRNERDAPCARLRPGVSRRLFAVVSFLPPRPPLAPRSPLFASDPKPRRQAVVAVQRASLSKATSPNLSQVPYHAQTAAPSTWSGQALQRSIRIISQPISSPQATKEKKRKTHTQEDPPLSVGRASILPGRVFWAVSPLRRSSVDGPRVPKIPLRRISHRASLRGRRRGEVVDQRRRPSPSLVRRRGWVERSGTRGRSLFSAVVVVVVGTANGGSWDLGWAPRMAQRFCEQLRARGEARVHSHPRPILQRRFL